MPLYQVIQILKTNCETIKTVQLIYNDKVYKGFKILCELNERRPDLKRFC
jgi:hypothetical protein